MSCSAVEILTLKNLKEVPEGVLRSVINTQGTLDGILDKPFEEIVYAGFDLRAAEAVKNADKGFAEDQLERLDKMGGRLYTIYSPEYPQLLREIHAPPLCLYVLGDISCLNELCISIVGARKSSRMGEDMATKLAFDLAGCGVTVVSGLAYGIDINAHQGALKANGATAAVLGSGLGDIYPKNHTKYISKIAEKGCVVSEFFLDEGPHAYNFPRRNRVISGLSRGVVVVEASRRSGSLITARLALEQGRDVFAVPVSPLLYNNATNHLIRNGAILIESYLDIIEEFSYLIKNGYLPEEKKKEFATPACEAVYNMLAVDAANIDELLSGTDLGYDDLVYAITMLELDDLIVKSADGRYAAKNIN